MRGDPDALVNGPPGLVPLPPVNPTYRNRNPPRMGTIEQRLSDLGITVPEAPAPAANYVPTVISGTMLYVSGQISMVDGKPGFIGKLGAEIDGPTGQEAARACGLALIAQAKAALGELDRVVRVVKLTGFVNSTPDFDQQPMVVNGCSNLIAEVFGDAGKHARSAVGVANLPFGVAVEVEGIFEIR